MLNGYLICPSKSSSYRRTIFLVWINTTPNSGGTMENNDHIFLTVPQLLESIRLDFAQHTGQTILFQKLIPILWEHNGLVVDTGPHTGVWLKQGRKSKPKRVRDDTLRDLILKKMTADPDLNNKLPALCRLIFQANAWASTDDASGAQGVWIDTEMRHFNCRHCGNCCHALQYHDACCNEDVARWRKLERNDILAWVRIRESGTPHERYSIWVDPITKQFSQICPWLDQNIKQHRCRIHDVKPLVCQQYPGTRKHAAMTGCIGFS